MGYRSDVAFACTEEVYNKNKNVIDAIEASEKKTENGIVSIRWEWVKWYPTYEEVAAIMKLVEDFPDDTAFVRVGEEEGDIEIKNNPFEFGIGYTQGVYI